MMTRRSEIKPCCCPRKIYHSRSTNTKQYSGV